MTISEVRAMPHPHQRAVKLLQGVSKRLPDHKDAELMLIFEGYIK
jgi:hypothetical protein